jgi:hypothetical protein
VRWPQERGRLSASPGVHWWPERARRRSRTFQKHLAPAAELAPSASGYPPMTASREEAADRGWGVADRASWGAADRVRLG